MLYLVLCLCYLLKIVMADLPNPVFTEIAFTVNTSDEYSMNNFLYSTAATVSSQDFQAVLLNSEEYQQTNVNILFHTHTQTYFVFFFFFFFREFY